MHTALFGFVGVLVTLALAIPSSSQVASKGEQEKASIFIGGIYFEGAIAGKTPEGRPSVARMRTAGAEVEVEFSGFRSASDVATAVLNALEAKGVRAAKGQPNEVLVILDSLNSPLGGQSTDDTLDSGVWKTRL